MEYYMPPPDPEAGHYHQYQYAAGFPMARHINEPVVLDPTAATVNTNTVEHYTNFPREQDIPNFGAQSPPTIPALETRDLFHRNNEHRASSSAQVKQGETVYKKAPGAPKRFKSSYVHFFTDFVEKKKKQLGPDGLPVKLDISSVSKECSQAWKALSPDQRKYWDYVSEQEKQEYNKQKAEYQGPWRIATSKTKKKKDGAPKRNPSAFFLFVNSKRPLLKEKFPDMPNTMVVKTCSETWKELSDSEKSPYQEEEKKLREQYHIDVEKWKGKVQEEADAEKDERKARRKADTAQKEARHLQAAASQHLRGASAFTSTPYFAPKLAAASAGPPARGRKRKRDKDPNAPKRSPPAFFLFVNHCRPELKVQYPELRHTELVKMLGQKWSEMTEEDKRPFRDHEEQLRQQYHVDMKNYKKGAVPEEEYHDNMPVLKSQPVGKMASARHHQYSPHQELHYQHASAQSQPNYGQHPSRDEDLGYQNYYATDL